MATRYWVGGAGTWNSTTTNWASTSGGSGGATIPGTTDDVVFDGNSGSGVITTAPGSGTTHGSLTLDTGFVGTLKLGQQVTFTNAFTLIQGTFNQNGFSFTCGSFVTSGSLTRAWTNTSGAVNLTATGNNTFWDVQSSTNFTYTPGTSTLSIVFVSAGTYTFNGGGLTYHGFAWTDQTHTNSQILVITGANSFSSFNVTDTNACTRTVTLPASTTTTVTGTLTLSNPFGGSITIKSSSPGTQATLSAATFSFTNTGGSMNISDNIAAGAASPFTVSPPSAFMVLSNTLNWQYVQVKVQQSKGRIVSTRTSTQSANGRIAKLVTKTQSANSRIRNTVNKYQTSNSRVQKIFTKTQSANARISKLLTKTQSANSRIQKIVTKTQSANSRISKLLTKTQSANSRITKLVTKTQTANSRIQVTSTKTQISNSRISKFLTSAQSANARILRTIFKTQTVNSRIQITGQKTINADARISKSIFKSQTASARIQSSSVAVAKIWTGSNWMIKPVKVYRGVGVWDTVPMKRWDGVSWELI